MVFGEFNQIEGWTLKNLTIFNAFSYLRHVKLSDIDGGPAGSSIFMKLWRNAGGSLLNFDPTATIQRDSW